MKAFLILAMLGVLVGAALAQTSSWMGSINTGGVALRVGLNITKAPDGTYTATVDSPDQGVKGFNTTTFSLIDDKVAYTVFGGSYEGVMSGDGREIVGTFKQAGRTFPLTFKRLDSKPDYSKPQDPKPPFPYDVEEVKYENMKQYVRLAGTITKPRGKGPFPAVVLITGSGAQNRDEEILGHRPFWVIADYLTRRGIEVLRVDDRGIGGSSGSVPLSTTADFVTDVLTGVEFLAARPEVDRHHIGLIGHSEGGIIAPMAAAESKDVGFIVMMAGTGLPGSEILPLQGGAIARASGKPEAAVERNVTLERRALHLFATEKDPDKRKAALRKLMEAQYAGLSPAERKEAPPLETALTLAIAQFDAPWFQYFLTLDPRPYLSRVQCPVLALNGSLDTQVPPDANLPQIRRALDAGGNTHYTIKELPGLNHLFQTAKTGAPTEYSGIQETISPIALKTIGDWILATVKS